MNLKIVSATYMLYGLVNLLISAVSRNVLLHMIILSGLCFLTGSGLLMKREWSIYPLTVSGLLTLLIGVLTLYSSVKFIGLDPILPFLVFNLSLVGYVLGALSVSIYIIVNRSNILSLDKRQSDKTEQVS